MSVVRHPLIGYTEFLTQYGPCHFLLCLRESSNILKESFPDGQYTKKNNIYTPTEAYCLEDYGRRVLFFKLKEAKLNERTGFCAMNFRPFPFSPN